MTSFWCRIGRHDWIYGKTERVCQRKTCGKKEKGHLALTDNRLSVLEWAKKESPA